jgi:hypothetical protein
VTVLERDPLRDVDRVEDRQSRPSAVWLMRRLPDAIEPRRLRGVSAW